MACREPPDAVLCVADGLWRVGRWRVGVDGCCAGSERMVCGGPVSGACIANRRCVGAIFGPLEYCPFRKKGYSPGETGLWSIIPSYFKKSVDEDRANEDTNFRCETRRYLSWIEGLTTNQYVGGSNPSRRTIETANHRGFPSVVFCFHGLILFRGCYLGANRRSLNPFRSLSIAAAAYRTKKCGVIGRKTCLALEPSRSF